MLKSFTLSSWPPFLVSLMLLGVAWACSRAGTAAPTAAGDPPVPRQLQFGTGGGFAGTVTTYTLYSDGRLERFMGSPVDTTRRGSPLKSPPEGSVARAFRAFDALPADSLTLREPGNLYYFLEGQTAAGRRASLVWGAPGRPAPHAVRALYRDLTAMIPRTD